MLKKIAQNTFAQIGSKIGTAVISIFLLSILTNYLSLELFWVYSKVYNYLWIFAFLADLWLYTIAVREISASKDEKMSEKIIWNIMTLRLWLWVWIAIWATSIALLLPWYNDSLTLLSIMIVSIFTIVSLLNSSLLSLMQAKMQIEFSLFSTIIGKLLNLWLICFIAFIWFPKDVYIWWDMNFLAIMWAGLAGIILNTGLNYYKARSLSPIRFLVDWDYIKHIIKISLPYGIALFLSVVYFKIDVILLWILEPTQVWNKSIGLYSLPMKIVEVVMVIGWFYLNSLLPSLTQLFQSKNTKKLKNILQLSFKIMLAAATIIFTLWVVLRNQIISIISDESIYLAPDLLYNSADALLIVLAVVVFYFISLIYIYIFIASKNQWQLLKINIYITLFNIIWNIILIPYYSFIGAAIITLVSQIILVWLWYYYSSKIISFKIPLWYICSIFIINIILYSLWNYFINSYSLWNIWDVLIYWWILFSIYGGIVYSMIKKRS